MSKEGEAIVEDLVATEEPLETQLLYFADGIQRRKSISVTMRTPGDDQALAAGFLFTEGVLINRGQIYKIKSSPGNQNIIVVSLAADAVPLLKGMERNFYTTSSCGICGKASIDAIRTVSPFRKSVSNGFKVDASVLYQLPAKLSAKQEVFESTGGLHAAALFTRSGNFIVLKEDVGRHNALDKLIGTAFIQNELPLSDAVLLLSGRASFELVQKAAMAGITLIAAVGAPSSLAVALAAEAGITLIGFLRAGRFNIYTHRERIISGK